MRIKQILPALAFIIFLSSCSTLRTLNFTNSKQITSIVPPVNKPQFIEDIKITPQSPVHNTELKEAPGLSATKSPNIIEVAEKEEAPVLNQEEANATPAIEAATPVQLKYAVLLNTEVENLPDKALLESVDKWYGVRYRTGGNTESGVDCSGFTVAVYTAVYGIALPRVAREQYRISRKISTTELQEGDLLFFNTRGRGVSHVGVYLGNNKFIHATVSKGVMVNGLFEPYYLKRFVGAGRIDDKQLVAHN